MPALEELGWDADWASALGQLEDDNLIPARVAAQHRGAYVVWTATGENMENFGVPPDVHVDNTPADFIKGRDAQIEKAVEILKQELANRKTTTSAPQR